MEQVISVYGKFLLEGLTLVAVFILLFVGIQDDAGNQGVFAIVGANLQTGDTDYESYNDFSVYRTESGKSNPEIVNETGVALAIGTTKLADHIKATDYEGNTLPIKVSSILDPAGTEIVASYNASTTEITLGSIGIYTITVSAMDSVNRKTVCTLKVPVNQ